MHSIHRSIKTRECSKTENSGVTGLEVVAWGVLKAEFETDFYPDNVVCLGRGGSIL